MVLDVGHAGGEDFPLAEATGRLQGHGDHHLASTCENTGFWIRISLNADLDLDPYSGFRILDCGS